MDLRDFTSESLMTPNLQVDEQHCLGPNAFHVRIQLDPPPGVTLKEPQGVCCTKVCRLDVETNIPLLAPRSQRWFLLLARITCTRRSVKSHGQTARALLGLALFQLRDSVHM